MIFVFILADCARANDMLFICCFLFVFLFLPDYRKSRKRLINLMTA